MTKSTVTNRPVGTLVIAQQQQQELPVMPDPSTFNNKK